MQGLLQTWQGHKGLSWKRPTQHKLVGDNQNPNNPFSLLCFAFYLYLFLSHLSLRSELGYWQRQHWRCWPFLLQYLVLLFSIMSLSPSLPKASLLNYISPMCTYIFSYVLSASTQIQIQFASPIQVRAQIIFFLSFWDAYIPLTLALLVLVLLHARAPINSVLFLLFFYA